MTLFPNSSTVERLAVNEDVLGSNPSLGVFFGTMAEWSKAEVY